MLIFTSLGGAAFGLKANGVSLAVYLEQPKSSPSAKDSLVLLPVPEENPRKGVISWPGEYNMAGVSVRGIGHKEGKQVSFAIEVEGVRTGCLSLPLQDWTDHEIELIGDLDVLVLPSGDAKLIQKLVDEFDPRVLLVVPGSGGKIDTEVLKVCGAQGKEHVSEYKLKGSLPAEGREVVVLAK